MFTWLSEKIKEKATFSWLAQISTARAPWLGGILPPIGTLLMLGLVAGAMAGGLWLGTALWAGAVAQASAFYPLLGETLAGVLGFSLLTFWFSREIDTFGFSTREAREDFVYSQKVNPTRLDKLVEHVRQEVNIYFKQLYGNKHVDIPMPRLLTYSKGEIEIFSSGRNPGKSGIFFSSGVFDFRKTNLDQRQIAALVQMELVKIYLNRGMYRTITSMGASLANTLQNLNNSNSWLYRFLGLLVSPLQFILLLERSINRSYEYEAAGHVIKCGRGIDLMNAIDKKVCSTLETLPTNAELKVNQRAHMREPYNGFMSWLIQPFTNWIDRNELAGDDKTGYRIISLFDILVRECGYYINELWKKEPRATNLKNYLRPIVKANVGGNEVSLDTATTAQIPAIRQHHMNINTTLYRKIPAAARYDVIGPKGSGCVKPILQETGLAPVAGGGQPILLAQVRTARGRQRDVELDVRPAQEGTHQMRLRRNR
jgi:Zn-dependent protease with chaperone function